MSDDTGPREPAEQSRLRAADADRHRVAEVLHRAAGDGRITLDELSEQLSIVYAAGTCAELEPLTRDLPAVGTGAGSAGQGSR